MLPQPSRPAVTQAGQNTPNVHARHQHTRLPSMATTTTQPHSPRVPEISNRTYSATRPSLPPLLHTQGFQSNPSIATYSPSQTSISSHRHSPSVSSQKGALEQWRGSEHAQSAVRPSLSTTSSNSVNEYRNENIWRVQHQSSPSDHAADAYTGPHTTPSQPHGDYTPPLSSSRMPMPLSATTSPVFSEPGMSPYRSTTDHYRYSVQSPTSDQSYHNARVSATSYSTTTTTGSRADVTSSSQTVRCSLHIRQQPRAARAGPDGKDRRAIDPPPVLQLLIDDFDPESDEDMNEILSNYFVVHCRLVSASGGRDVSALSSVNDEGVVDVQRLLLGTTVSSPFHCQDDPDPSHMPIHPTTRRVSPVTPSSPSMRFIQTSRAKQPGKGKQPAQKPENLPGSFFIFADLSVRKAGEYRLEFCLMKIEPSNMISGSRLPIIHSVISDVFKVVNAKDFDQVQPSTDLVKGLLDRGAGFPLKLKKGSREGQRRKPTQDDSDDDDDDDDEDMR